ncbi:MAG: metal ABC transporter permease [Lachnospiraceae bacterium]|nr:metal ABC transporter permease [Lachnospiraceae bacterium]MDD3661397.1 metal ABC transporter permease [Lachnospiraceae bacterium]
MLEALFTYRFLQNALIAGLLASVVCGIVGVIIVEKKLIMMSGGIAHTAYGGVGFGYLIGIEPIIGAFLFSVASAFGVGYVKRKGSVQSDVLIGLFWSLGMALGILFIALTPGYPPDMNSYLFGNILSVTRSDLYLMIVLTVIVVAVITVFFQLWKVYLFDDEFSQIIGIRSTIMEYILLVLVALTIVVLIRVAGIILVLALLTAPAASAGLFSKNLKSRMILAIGFGMLFCISGLAVSYVLNIASGASIVIISVVFYFIASMIKGVLFK